MWAERAARYRHPASTKFIAPPYIHLVTFNVHPFPCPSHTLRSSSECSLSLPPFLSSPLPPHIRYAAMQNPRPPGLNLPSHTNLIVNDLFSPWGAEDEQDVALQLVRRRVHGNGLQLEERMHRYDTALCLPDL